MLAVRDTASAELAAAGLDAGAAAAMLARLWAEAGRHVLLVDADAHGTGLAGRVGAATGSQLQTALRGLPSLIASRTPLSGESAVEHSWVLRCAGGGSVRLLGAPAHPEGATIAAGWLADRVDGLAALGRRWAVIVSMPGPASPAYERLADAASQHLVVDAAAGTAPPGGLRGVLSAFWVRFAPDPVLRLTASGPGIAEPDGSDGVEACVPLVGGISRARPAVLLGRRPRRRDRGLMDAFAAVAGRLSVPGEAPAALIAQAAGTNGRADGSLHASMVTKGLAGGVSPRGAGP